MDQNDLLAEERQGEVLDRPVDALHEGRKKIYVESYGCQMNFSDSEIVVSILEEKGFNTTPDYHLADVVLINTCAIRDNAEQRVRNRLQEFRAVKKKNPELVIGVLGCMAERLKAKLLEEEKLVDLVAGPDAYRTLPALLQEVESGRKAVNVILSTEETYDDITPVRLDSNGVTAFISIMRGCDNMCSFCVVPFTRGRERSRDPQTIVQEAKDLFAKGYREVTLLGQNVDSYLWAGGGPKKDIIKSGKDAINFAGLLEMVAKVNPDLRIRFSTSHPKDITEDVLHTMAAHENICNYIHLPVQSGNSRILEKMNRGYTREWYMDRVEMIRRIIPDIAISTDVICGFCSEEEADHQETLSMMEWAAFDFAYMFKYSERPGTLAERKYSDDVTESLKTKRLEQVIELQQRMSLESNEKDIGKVFRVLVEGVSKRSQEHLYGRNDQNKVMIFPKGNLVRGQYVHVRADRCTAATLMGEVVEHA
ncbi:MAG: tRNA (N6-isopentenyl adenosine(37)-C2)-methylthiotransferase MiaB [Flavobacteriales bacterium]|nr:tRNA (N6-isopentenyl adenosine(37)-C2)-methylthiotransferase MiaB [Flavobacteriales bacterium]